MPYKYYLTCVLFFGGVSYVHSMNFCKFSFGKQSVKSINMSHHYKIMPDKNIKEKYLEQIKILNEIQDYPVGKVSQCFTQGYSKPHDVSKNIDSSEDIDDDNNQKK